MPKARANPFAPAAGFVPYQRKELERLCRYITRPAIANERLSRNAKGQVVLKLKSPYRDGTTHIVMQPQEFMQRLAALMPRPRLHLIRFHGVLAPHAKLRAAIVPGTVEKGSDPAAEPMQRAARMSWARLLRRVFDIDMANCPHCGSACKIIAAIEEPAVIARILTHLGQPARRRALKRDRSHCSIRPEPQGNNASPNRAAARLGPRSGEGPQPP